MPTENLRRSNITIFTEFMTQSEFKDLLLETFSIDKVIIGHLETTEENNKEHFHSYVDFGRSVRFSTIKKVFPSSHIEKCFSNVKDNYNYITKEGEPYFINFDILDELNSSDKKESIEVSLINDIFDNHLSLYQIIKKYPHYAIYHFDNIQKILNVRKEHDKDLLLMKGKLVLTGELDELLNESDSFDIKVEIDD